MFLIILKCPPPLVEGELLKPLVRWRGKLPAHGAVDGEITPSVGVFENFGAVEGEWPPAVVVVEGQTSRYWCGGGKNLMSLVR